MRIERMGCVYTNGVRLQYQIAPIGSTNLQNGWNDVPINSSGVIQPFVATSSGELYLRIKNMQSSEQTPVSCNNDVCPNPANALAVYNSAVANYNNAYNNYAISTSNYFNNINTLGSALANYWLPDWFDANSNYSQIIYNNDYTTIANLDTSNSNTFVSSGARSNELAPVTNAEYSYESITNNLKIHMVLIIITIL